MYAILVYDVSEKRLRRVLKTCRTYLLRSQRSVFEGKITPARLDALKQSLARLIDPSEDSVCVYTVDEPWELSKNAIGMIYGSISDTDTVFD